VPPPPENTREIINYIKFYGGEDINNKTEKINGALHELEKNNMRAVFFLSGSEILENPDIVRKIHASGQSLGIKLEGAAVTEETKTELEAVNNLIYALVKHKTRLFILGEGANAGAAGETELTRITGITDKLISEGYYLCGSASKASGRNLAGVMNPNGMIEFVKREQINIFAFDISSDYADYIGWLAEAAKEKFYISVSHINSANAAKITDVLK
jgi:hypothetical protein